MTFVVKITVVLCWCWPRCRYVFVDISSLYIAHHHYHFVQEIGYIFWWGLWWKSFLQSFRWLFLSVCSCSCVCGGNSNITKVCFKQCFMYQIKSFLSTDMWSRQLQSCWKRKKNKWYIQGEAIIKHWAASDISCIHFMRIWNLDNGQWKLRLNFLPNFPIYRWCSYSCLVFSWRRMEMAEDATKVGGCQRNRSWCTNVKMFYSFNISILNCLLKNKTVTKLSKNLYRSREGFVEKDFKGVPLIDWYKATQTGTRFTSITAMLISLSISRNRCDRHAWSRWFGENLLFTTGPPRRLVEMGRLHFCPRSTFPSVLD